MGNEIVKRLLKKWEVTVWTRSSEKSEEFQKKNPTNCNREESPAAAISKGDIIFVMLTDGNSVKNTILSEDSKKFLHGKIIIQMSTISSRENIELDKEVQSHGGIFIECPVLGSSPAAANGTLQLLLTGPKIHCDSIREVLEVVGKIRDIGQEIGKSSVLKLALNQLIGAQVSAISVSMSMVKTQGLPIETFWNIMKENGTMFCPYFDYKFNSLNQRDHSHVTFSASNFRKDMGLVVKEMEDMNLESSSVKGIEHLLAAAVESGYAEDDMSSIIEGVLKHKKGE